MARLVGQRQDAGDVEIGAAEKHSVVAGRRRHDVEPFQPGGEQLIGLVGQRFLRENQAGRQRGWDGDDGETDLAGVASEDGRIAASAGGDAAGVVRAGDLGIDRLEARPARGVLLAAIGQLRPDAQTLNLIRSHERQDRRIDADGQHAAGTERHVRFDPRSQELVFRAAGSEADTAAMRQRAGRLEQQQAHFGPHAIDAPAEVGGANGLVIGLGIGGEQRETEITFAGECPVTLAGAATELVEQRRDVPRERRRFRPRNGG